MKLNHSLVRAVLGAAALSLLAPAAHSEDNPTMRMTTTLGDITIELYPDEAPETVRNFIAYIESGHFDGTIFHRVIPDFVVQGGGFTPDMQQRDTRDPIQNEANNGLKNLVGSLSMARTSDPNSATSQFFINLKDNAFLDHTAETPSGWGYAVFAKVVDGMAVVEEMATVATGNNGPFQDVPQEPIIITKASMLE